MAKQSFKTALIETVPRTPGTLSLRFLRPEGFDYIAGQWFTLTLASAGEPLVSHFTFSSSPTEPFLEFTTRLSGSAFKNTLLELKPGDEVEMEGPYGGFVLKDAERMAFLIGGIGVTPLRSMLRFLDDTHVNRTIVVFYGSMTEDGIVFREELEAIAGRLPGVRIVHVLATPEDSWTGYRGFIRAEVIRAELGDPTEWTFYVCGPPPMIAPMRALLTELEIPSKQAVFESFAGYQTQT
jgi:ferredoxin-NADP reductase